MDISTWKKQKNSLSKKIMIRLLPGDYDRVVAAARAHYWGNVSDLVRHAISLLLERLEETDGQTEGVE